MAKQKTWRPKTIGDDADLRLGRPADSQPTRKPWDAGGTEDIGCPEDDSIGLPHIFVSIERERREIALAETLPEVRDKLDGAQTAPSRQG